MWLCSGYQSDSKPRASASRASFTGWMVRSRQKLVMPTFTAGSLQPPAPAHQPAPPWVGSRARSPSSPGPLRGLGRGFAEALAAEGAALALCDVQPEVGTVAASLMEQYGVAASVYVADVGDPTDVWRVVDETVASLGGVDILVNNAGICVPTDPTAGLEESVADFDRTFDVNTRGTFLFGRAVMPVMLGSGWRSHRQRRDRPRVHRAAASAARRRGRWTSTTRPSGPSTA